MTAPEQPSADEAASAPLHVQRERASDAVTGLPIWRYRFRGEPTLPLRGPTPAGIWRLLSVKHEGEATIIETESGTGLVPLSEAPAWFDDDRLGQALDLLRNARGVGVAHGDLGVHRLYRHGPRLWIEGYGVPWRAGASVEADTKALAHDLLHFDGTRLSDHGRARLRAVLASGDPAAEPGPLHRQPLASEQLAPESEPPIEIDPSSVGGSVVFAPPPGSTVHSGAASSFVGAWSERAAAAVGGAGTAVRGAGAAVGAAVGSAVGGALQQTKERLGRSLRGGVQAAGARLRGRLAPSEVDPPIVPAATSAPQSAAAELLSPQLRLLVVALLLIGAVAWGVLALPASSGRPAPATAAQGVWISATLEPPGHPPAMLIALESPNGSSIAPGRSVGTIPGSVMLDRAGRWVLQARFGDRYSEPIAMVAPFDQLLIFHFAAPSAP